MDNVFIERLGRMTQIRVRVPQRLRGGELGRFGIGRWIGYCNAAWLRASFGGKTPTRSVLSSPRRRRLRNWLT